MHTTPLVDGLKAPGWRGTECKYYAEHSLQDAVPVLFTARVLRLFSSLRLLASLVLDFESGKRVENSSNDFCLALIKELQTLLAIGLGPF